MRNEFVTHKQALALNELDFNEPCITSYDDEGLLRNPFDYDNSQYHAISNKQQYYEDAKHFVYNSELTTIGRQFVAAPTYSQAFEFFRIMHGLYISILPKKLWPDNRVTGTQWYVEICGGDGKDIGPAGIFTYKDAEKACLDKLIELTKNKSK